MSANKKTFMQTQATASNEVTTLPKDFVITPDGVIRRRLDVKDDPETRDIIAHRERSMRYQEAREKSAAKRKAEAEKRLQATLVKNTEAAATLSERERREKQAEKARLWRESRTKYGITEQAEKAIADKLTYDYVISEKTVMPLAIAAALKSLRFFLNRSGQPRMFELYFNLLTDVNRHIHDVGSVLTDAMDLVQTAAMTFCKYKKSADERHEAAPDSRSESDGTYTNGKTGLPVTIFGEAIHEVNKLIAANRRKTSKAVYIEDIDENGLGYIEVPDGWDCESIDDLAYYNSAIAELCDPAKPIQEKILRLRLSGVAVDDPRAMQVSEYAKKRGLTRDPFGVKTVAKKVRRAPSYVRKVLQDIGRKAAELGYPVPKK